VQIPWCQTSESDTAMTSRKLTEPMVMLITLTYMLIFSGIQKIKIIIATFIY
jgi:hypothetical protein